MSNTPHQLAEEFPEYVGKIRHLREVDGHFHRITEDYDVVNRAIHRAETNIEPADDFHMADMRKERMRLKDEIYGTLTRLETAEERP
ncbi:uncharacterized protein YdcH (DUF465 family) [Mycoplana sp. BE70]|uniref:YdcH family protein n=1 Tax=Mycoplana sp. BE70 TaxID=2817775 RepID=UPI002855643D|nr:DUF465 domain-containing protein [Mycoplana sp. BE70]MDR6758241.1 uncharacterized protein YdcH (DUF465 family) [Mycoplana sp. BE70]